MKLPSFYIAFANLKRRLSGRIVRSLEALRAVPETGAGALTSAGLAYPIFTRPLFRRVFLIVGVGASGFTEATGLYSHAQLTRDLKAYLAETYRRVPHDRIDISLGHLDNRLRLGQCPSPVQFTAQDLTGLGGNISVKAQCTSVNINWSVHIPAQVMIHQAIPVASQDIVRGQRITEAHIALALVNVSTIRQAFATEPSAALGREARRNIGKGDVFRASLLDAPTAVRRGDVVALESVAGSIKVSSSGTAMTDGRLGQKIRVRNETSERIVTGVVRAHGVVQAL